MNTQRWFLLDHSRILSSSQFFFSAFSCKYNGIVLICVFGQAHDGWQHDLYLFVFRFLFYVFSFQLFIITLWTMSMWILASIEIIIRQSCSVCVCVCGEWFVRSILSISLCLPSSTAEEKKKNARGNLLRNLRPPLFKNKLDKNEPRNGEKIEAFDGWKQPFFYVSKWAV